MKISGWLFFCCVGAALMQPAWAETDITGPLISGEKGIAITEADIQEELLLATPEVREDVLRNSDYIKQLAASLYARRYLAAEAIALGLDKAPEVMASLKRNHDKVLSEAATVHRDGPAPDPVLVEKLAQAQYRAYPEKYQASEKVRAAHILISNTKPDAKKIADDLHARLLAGEKFEAAVEKYSDDPGSRQRGGDLGWFERGKMVKAFEDAAFALKEADEYSPVVETEFGYHIIKLYGKLKPGLLPFSEVKDQISKEVIAGLAKQRRSETSDSVMKSAKVDNAAIERMVSKFGTKR